MSHVNVQTQEGVRVQLYASEWITALYAISFAPSITAAVWDLLMVDGKLVRKIAARRALFCVCLFAWVCCLFCLSRGRRPSGICVCEYVCLWMYVWLSCRRGFRPLAPFERLNGQRVSMFDYHIAVSIKTLAPIERWWMAVSAMHGNAAIFSNSNSLRMGTCFYVCDGAGSYRRGHLACVSVCLFVFFVISFGPLLKVAFWQKIICVQVLFKVGLALLASYQGMSAHLIFSFFPFIYIFLY